MNGAHAHNTLNSVCGLPQSIGTALFRAEWSAQDVRGTRRLTRARACLLLRAILRADRGDYGRWTCPTHGGGPCSPKWDVRKHGVPMCVRGWDHPLARRMRPLWQVAAERTEGGGGG